uniref:Uncharacterized protein n=1 Tax=Anopheles coluzzii TaxID=1518534 RepID=A0A8W7PMC3_ANOCL
MEERESEEQRNRVVLHQATNKTVRNLLPLPGNEAPKDRSTGRDTDDGFLTRFSALVGVHDRSIQIARRGAQISGRSVRKYQGPGTVPQYAKACSIDYSVPQGQRLSKIRV